MTKYLDESGLLYLWGKLKATFLHNASEGRFTGVSTNTSTGLMTFNVPTIAEHIYYDSNKNSTLKDKIDTIVSQGGEPNTIETVKVNGTALVPDANKAVNITFTDTDTKNTAGATNVVYGNGEVLYYIGAKELTANPQTYSESNLYSTKAGQLYGNFAGVHFVKLNESNTSTSWAINVNEIFGAKTVDIVSPTTLGLYAGTTLGLDAPTINVTQLSEVNLVGGDFSQIVAGNTDLQTALNAKAPLASPALTGTPTAPTAAAGTNTTQIATTSFVNTAITNALGNFTGVSYEVVQTLPASGAAGTIYLISNSGTNPNIYDEYIYVNNGFEKIGTTDIDLTNYLTEETDPIFTASAAHGITSSDISNWNGKANQSTTYTKTEVDALFDDVAYLGDDDGQATTLDFDPQADTVWNIPQTLGSSQQAQARANIGVVDVSGTNDGTNWTSITIGSTTKAIPSGGSSGDENVIESITFNGTAATIDSTTKNAAISYTPPVTSVNNQTGAVSLALGETNVIETVKINGTALTPTNKAVDISVPSAVTESTVSGWGFTKNTGNVSSTDVVTIVKITQAAYDALSTKDSSTLYVITS